VPQIFQDDLLAFKMTHEHSLAPVFGHSVGVSSVLLALCVLTAALSLFVSL